MHESPIHHSTRSDAENCLRPPNVTSEPGAHTAFAETQRRVGIDGHNDKSDAFRHCFWSAILSRELGFMNALEFTTAHESSPTNPPNE